MSYVIATPDMLAAAASDLTNIGSALGAANSAALARTTGLLAAAEDEVSTAIASLFSASAREYQIVSTQAAHLHAEFVHSLTRAGAGYAAADAVNASPLQTLQQNVLAAINAPSQALTARPLFGDGADGAPGTGQNGGDGGWLLGDGGAGARRTVGAIADQRPPGQRLYRRIDRLQQLLKRSGVGGLGSCVGASGAAQRPHKLLVKSYRLRAQLLIGLTVNRKQRRDRR